MVIGSYINWHRKRPCLLFLTPPPPLLLPLISSTMPAVYTHKFDTPVFSGAVEIPTGIFIDGKWRDGSDGGLIE